MLTSLSDSEYIKREQNNVTSRGEKLYLAAVGP